MTRLSKWVQLIAALAVLAAPVAARQVTPAALLLEAANHKAVLEGDLRGAIRIYQDVVARFGTSDRAAAAMALLKMGEYFETLGDPQAPKAYEQVATQYADQVATAAAASARLRSGVPRLICEECADVFGSISPDGRFLATTKAYAGGDRAGDIGLLELSSRTLAALRIEGSGAEATGLAMAPVFSPDGRQIVYAWLSQSGNGLRIIPREPSGKMRVLQRAGAPPSVLLPLAWSPSGLILALSQESDRRMALVTVAAADGAVRSLKTLGFRVSPGPHIASASPDGRFVAYEQFVTDPPAFVNLRNGAGLDRQIHVIAADGSNDVPVTTGAGVKRWATWTPNGSHVLYVSNVAGAWDLWATPIRDGRPAGEAVLVRKNIGNVTSLGVSAAGAYHFYEGRAGVLRASLIPTAGSAPGAARLADSLIGTGPVWSPDGKAIAVGRPGAVVVRIIATGEERAFARTGVAPLPFMWFPDSTALLVQVRESANAQSWYRLELASGEFRKLVQEKSDPGFWTHQNVRTLSPDGRTLFYGTCADQACLELNRITALDLETGTYRNVVQLPAANGGLPKTEQDFAVAASPDGLSLALMHRDLKLNATHLAVVGVNGQGYRELLPPIQATNLRNKLVWSRDGRFIYFTTKTGSPGGDVHRVMRVAVSGGAPEPAGLEADRLESFDVSPDGTRLAFSTQRAEGGGELHWSLDVSWLMKGIRQAEISPVISVGPNVQVSIDRPNQAHSEPTIAADPTDAGRLLLGVHIAHPLPTGVKSMVYASLDSGRTWRASLEPKDATAGDDATVAFGPTGTAFFSSLSAQGGLFRSTDGGRTWEAPTRIPRGYSRDRSYLVADNTGGRFNGRLYLTGTVIPRLTFNSLGSHPGTGLYASVDDGRTFGNPILRLGAWSWNPNDGTDPDGVHVEMAYHIGNSNSVVLSDGTVLWAYGRSKPGSDNRLSWARDRTAPIRPLSVANFWLEIIGSSDGGETLIEARRIGDMWMNGSRSRTAGAHLAVDPGSAAFKDRLYVVWADFRSNRLEVFLSYSADRGTTWSPSVRINDDQPARDPLIDGPDATHPTVAVNRDGVVAVTWYDRRESQDNLSWHLRMRASLDGGDSWLPSVRVSEQPNTFGGGERWDIGGGIGPGSDNGNPRVLTTFLSYAGFFKEAGDNNGFVADAAGVFHPIWIDNRTGVRQVWTADVRVRGAAGVNGGGDLAALRDQGSRIRLGGEMAINPATGTLTIVARLRNDTRTETIRGPLKVRLLDLSSELAETIEAVNADNGMAQGGAVWDFSQLIPASGLAPGSISESRVMEFHLTGLRQTFRNGGVITTGMAGFRARVLGPGPAPAK